MDGLLSGKVLDFGAGTKPYQWIIEAADGEYVPYDHSGFPGAVMDGYSTDRKPKDTDLFTAIVCTQVIQYVPYPVVMLEWFKELLLPTRGWLIMTGPTNWPVVEKTDDLQRYTKEGITRELMTAGFIGVQVEERAAVTFEGEAWSLGWTARGQA